MRIAIINITGGGISGGYKKYLSNLLPQLSSNPEITAILCAAPSAINVQEWVKNYPKIQFHNCLKFSIFRKKDVELDLKLTNFNPDVIFIPLERYYGFGNKPTVNMSRNMLPFVKINNNTVYESVRNYFQKIVSISAIKKSDRVIAVSDYVKNLLAVQFHIPDKKIGRVYHGLDFDNSRSLIRPNNIPNCFDKNFIFTAGSIDPYRGLEDVLYALSELAPQDTSLRLVIAGGVRPHMRTFHEKLKALTLQLDLNDKVFWAGNLTESEMAWCYSKCSIFVMTSRVEACPNIALEAMFYGCLCVSSQNKPMPEFFQDAALYYQAQDPRSLETAITKASNLTLDRKKEYSKLAQMRATQFTWELTAKNTIVELQKACIARASA